MSDKRAEWWPLKAVVQSSSVPSHTRQAINCDRSRETTVVWKVSALKEDFMDKVIQNKHILKMNWRGDAEFSKSLSLKDV